MIKSVSMITLFTAVFFGITTNGVLCEGQQAEPRTAEAQNVGSKKPKPVNSLAPLREGSKNQIIAYYKKIPATVEAKIIEVKDTNLLCLSIDTGSGKYIISVFVYAGKEGRWTLFHYRQASGDCIGVGFSMKDHHNLQVRGWFVSKKKGQLKYISKVVDTVLVKPK